jgi:hypothetical protein
VLGGILGEVLGDVLGQVLGDVLGEVLREMPLAADVFDVMQNASDGLDVIVLAADS